MNFGTKHIKVYLPATLLGLLIVKLMLGGTLLYMKRPVLPVPILDSRPALAEDADSPPPSQPSLDSRNVEAGLEILERKRAEIETERQQLERERKQLRAFKQEIEAKLIQLSEIQDSIQRKLDEHKMIRDNKIKHLIKIYSTMAPKKAAALIEKLDKELIMELFSQMKVEQVGQILPHMSAENATKVGEHLARRK
jgi:flagellar motility protein MotE (MotC chaperone)